jgi:hypothetical protein
MVKFELMHMYCRRKLRARKSFLVPKGAPLAFLRTYSNLIEKVFLTHDPAFISNG